MKIHRQLNSSSTFQAENARDCKPRLKPWTPPTKSLRPKDNPEDCQDQGDDYSDITLDED